MSETVLVTGGTGFVGAWCIVELLRRGYTVRTTVRSLNKEAAVRASTKGGERLTFHVADLTKDDGWDAAAEGCDYVLHVASPLGGDSPKDPNALIIPAREGTLRVLRAATKARVKRVVVTSSVAASSEPPASPDGDCDENTWTDPNAPGVNAYRQSKVLQNGCRIRI